VHGTAVHERELLSGAERLAAQRAAAICATPRGQHPVGQTAFGLAAVASWIARHRVHAQSVDVPIDRALSPRSEALTAAREKREVLGSSTTTSSCVMQSSQTGPLSVIVVAW